MSNRSTALPVAGILALCFFGISCLYHAVYWVWVASAYGADKHEAMKHLLLWVVLAALAALGWCWLMWLVYFPKKKDKA
jgi:nitric oxide reductase large subunit